MASNAAKAYIEAVMARAALATVGPWWSESLVIHAAQPNPHGPHVCNCERDNDNDEQNAAFIAASRQDIPTLAKIALRAIAALESIDDDDMRCCDVSVSEKIAHVALAEINAMAKGSQ